MKTCRHCGAEIEDSAKYCEYCGMKADTVPAPQASEPQSETLCVGGRGTVVTLTSHDRMPRKKITAKSVVSKAACAAFIIALGVLFYFIKNCPWGDISKSDYDMISEGMSYSEVCRILGRESDGNMGFYFGKDNAFRTDHRYWLISRPQEVTLYVTFENDIVKSKSWSEGRPYR